MNTEYKGTDAGADQQSAILEAKNLEVQRGDRRLFTGLSFSVCSGTLLHVEGRNGSGKTTLLRVLCGLMLPQEGSVLWNGSSIHSLREDFASLVSYFGHLNGIKDDLTGLENLKISAELDGWRVSEEHLWHALDSAGLDGIEDLPVKVLSQGQKKRMALARLMLSQSPVWVLDEPFTALDVKAVESLEARIATHVAAGGIAIITTHQEVALTSGTLERLSLDR